MRPRWSTKETKYIWSSIPVLVIFGVIPVCCVCIEWKWKIACINAHIRDQENAIFFLEVFLHRCSASHFGVLMNSGPISNFLEKKSPRSKKYYNHPFRIYEWEIALHYVYFFPPDPNNGHRLGQHRKRQVLGNPKSEVLYLAQFDKFWKVTVIPRLGLSSFICERQCATCSTRSRKNISNDLRPI